MWHLIICPSRHLIFVWCAPESALVGAWILLACWQTVVPTELSHGSLASNKPSRGNPLCVQIKSVTALLWMKRKVRRHGERRPLSCLAYSPGEGPRWTSVSLKQRFPRDGAKLGGTRKKEPFLSHLFVLTPPKDAHPGDLLKHERAILGWRVYKELGMQPEIGVSLHRPQTASRGDSQVTDRDSLNSVGLWDQDWISKSSFLPTSIKKKNFFNPIMRFLENTLTASFF